jgi:hypothetical protein
MKLQEACYAAIEQYFVITIPQYVEGDSLQSFLRTFLESANIAEEFSVSAIKSLVRRNVLHLTSSVDVPDSLRSWEEFGTAFHDLNSFFQEIRSAIIDPITSVMSKIPSKQFEVASMRTKVTKALTEDTIMFESVSLLQSDLTELFKSSVDMSDLGVLFNKATLGVDRDELSTWREDIMKQYTKMKKTRQEEDDISKALADTYQQWTKIRKMPDITSQNWASFLFIWKSESEHYSTDLQRLGVIRSHLVDNVDKHSTEHISSLQEMLAYLYRRYGTESSVFQSMLTEILTLPHPKNEKEEEINLISALTSISTTESNRVLYTMDNRQIKRELLGQVPGLQGGAEGSHPIG